MSLGKRAYNVLRGYVSTEWERIRGLEQEIAERELRSAPAIPSKPADQSQALHEQASIECGDQSAVSTTPKPTRALPAMQPEDKRSYARRLLGLAEDCSFEEARKAFARLNKRSDPANFPAGSPEAGKAAEIQRKVAWAYGVLTEGMDATEQRFRTLELD